MTLGEKELLLRLPHRLYIGGRWVDAENASTFVVFDPATDKPIATIANASPADGLSALDAAVAAQDEWAATAPRARGEILRRVFELILERRDELALLMTLEMGKPLGEAQHEITYGAEFLRWFSEEAVRITGRYGQNPEGSGNMVVSQRPVGPCFLITPWNFPLAMATRKIAPALAAGCTVVIKPAELTPMTTLFVAALFDQAGLPPGVLNVITTLDAAVVSEPIIADGRLRKLSFTGSTPVGKILMKQAADNVLRTSMELGGNAPFLVFDDADIDRAVEGAVAAKFRNSGQACTAANRFIVHSAVAEQFASRLAEEVADMVVGRGTDAGVTTGPLINDAAVKKATDLVQDAISRGANLVAGGHPRDGVGSFFEPTILTGVPLGSSILNEEIFGPVVSIVVFDDEDEAIRLANNTEYGLVSYVFTGSHARGERMMRKLHTGMMGLNVGVISNAAAPFGGIKQSGLGREGGAEGIHEYLDTKYTLVPN